MAFNSIEYLLLLCASLLAYYASPARWRWALLVVLSWAFYASWRPEFLVVLVSVTAAQYVLARLMARQSRIGLRRCCLYGSILAGLAVLGYFKYGSFLRSLLQPLFHLGETRGVSRITTVLVPIGLSFYTLQTIGYLLGVYHRRVEPEKHFGVFAAFVSFFPIVVSGPIERSTHLLPQLQRTHRIAFSCENIASGVKLIIWGLFLKLVIADRTALYVDAVFGNPDRHSGLSFLLATVFYSFQIYADFAGYSSVAIGSAKLLGIDILENFNRPYLASSIREFWRRWHISLSSWLRDYLYLPLAYALSRRMPKDRYGGMRVDTLVYAMATLVTFSLCGLWHGAAMTYVVWGSLHGLYLVVENGFKRPARNNPVAIARTYALVLASWVFFRADSVAAAFDILKKIALEPGRLYVPSGPDVVAPLYALAGIAILAAIELKREFWPGAWSFLSHRNAHVRTLAYSLLVCVILLIGVFDGGQFIYAQF